MADIPPGVNVYETAQSSLYAATFATFSLASVAVCLRFGSRWLTQSRRGWDDWLIVGALVVSFGLVLDMVLWIRSGFGRHYELYGPSVFPRFFQYLFISDLAYSAIMVLVKFSMLAFYTRTFDERRQLRAPLTFLGMFLACWLVASIVTAALQCDPSGEECAMASRGFPLGMWVPNMATNAVIIGLPLRYWRRDGMNPTQRTLLYAVFGAALFVCAVSGMRLLSLLYQNPESLDFTWEMVPFGVWTLVESNAAIVAACLPTFKPVWLAIDIDQASTREAESESASFAKHHGHVPAPAWLDKHKMQSEPSTPYTPVTPGTGSARFRDSEDLERATGFSETSFSDEDEEEKRLKGLI